MRRVDRCEGDTPEVKREAQNSDRCRYIELCHDIIDTGGVDSEAKGAASIVSQTLVDVRAQQLYTANANAHDTAEAYVRR